MPDNSFKPSQLPGRASFAGVQHKGVPAALRLTRTESAAPQLV